jgi:hypothetical protein
VDKVDLVLRRRVNGAPVYREVQVKFGKLYRCTQAWERPLFDVSSWRFFKDGEVEDADPGLYLAYVLSEDDEYRGDFFIFPAREFASIIRAAPMVSPSKPKRRVYVSRCVDDPGRCYDASRGSRGSMRRHASTCRHTGAPSTSLSRSSGESPAPSRATGMLPPGRKTEVETRRAGSVERTERGRFAQGHPSPPESTRRGRCRTTRSSSSGSASKGLAECVSTGHFRRMPG